MYYFFKVICSSLYLFIHIKLWINGFYPLQTVFFLLYQYLLETANFLASLNTDQTIPTLPKYEHENLLSVFSKLVEFCNDSISFIKQPFITIPFEKTANGFVLLLEKGWLQDKG